MRIKSIGSERLSPEMILIGLLQEFERKLGGIESSIRNISKTKNASSSLIGDEERRRLIASNRLSACKYAGEARSVLEQIDEELARAEILGFECRA